MRDGVGKPFYWDSARARICVLAPNSHTDPRQRRSIEAGQMSAPDQALQWRPGLFLRFPGRLLMTLSCTGARDADRI